MARFLQRREQLIFIEVSPRESGPHLQQGERPEDGKNWQREKHRDLEKKARSSFPSLAFLPPILQHVRNTPWYRMVSVIRGGFSLRQPRDERRPGWPLQDSTRLISRVVGRETTQLSPQDFIHLDLGNGGGRGRNQ